ncbi:DUF1542 domain-containing protein [Frigoriglobus tundricola]|uniref:DUF4064 domain-containing protein n=1 Tax=Frigoriglobus tundricola TaxID=2774151 RepID=A0A6M5YRD0_9BACT|nr:DUF1542 domain-containing protein [Frigoriglobus tundricola]QJW95990.1 hypothetical protein FTUN_3544 [Frigoriglobus tundricola]
MSGYPDDRDDELDRRDDELDIRTAKSAVIVPAIGLIVVAAFGLLSIVSGIIQFPGLDAAFDEQIDQVEANPQFTAEQKKQQVQMWNQLRDVTKAAWFPLYGIIGLVSILIFVGGFKLMNLSSPGLVYLSAILSFVPCVSGCCFLGLVFGIWALVVMGKPEVKAGFAARRRAAYSSDAN